MPFPDFLCIGAPRSGTTWLYCNLKRHPQIWLPPVKELHYFNEMKGDRFGVLSRFFTYKRVRIRRTLVRQLKRTIRKPDLNDVKWRLHYFLRKPDDDWYAKCFDPAQGRLTGDFTPAYSSLSDRKIEEIASIMPHIKIIYLLRNPIDRTWSSVRFHYDYVKEPVPIEDEDEIIEYATDNIQRGHSNYTGNIDRWLKHFPSEKLFIGFYNEIVDCPGDLLSRICRFLGVDDSPGSYSSRFLHRVVNAKEKCPMSENIRRTLIETYYPALEQSHERFGGYATGWLNEARSFMQQVGAQ